MKLCWALTDSIVGKHQVVLFIYTISRAIVIVLDFAIEIKFQFEIQNGGLQGSTWAIKKILTCFQFRSFRRASCWHQRRKNWDKKVTLFWPFKAHLFKIYLWPHSTTLVVTTVHLYDNNDLSYHLLFVLQAVNLLQVIFLKREKRQQWQRIVKIWVFGMPYTIYSS